MINALELQGKKMEEATVVCLGAGAAAIACMKLLVSCGIRSDNIYMLDRKGVLDSGRDDMNQYKAMFANETDKRTLDDAIDGADVFVGLSGPDLLSAEQLAKMAPNPIVFACSNPDPEINHALAMATRDDAIMATGRSDYPNQVNNVLGFPFIFRGALDVRARGVTDGMKLAATHALAELTRQDVPESVARAYGEEAFTFGRDYIIPKPFDHRVLLWVAPAVAEAAMADGVARTEVDLEEYRRRLEARLGRRREVMRDIMLMAQREPRRIVYPEGEDDRVLRAVAQATADGL